MALKDCWKLPLHPASSTSLPRLTRLPSNWTSPTWTRKSTTTCTKRNAPHKVPFFFFPHISNIESFRYHKSKLCQILTTRHLAPLIVSNGVTVNALCPGAVTGTHIFDNSSWFIRFITGFICLPFFKVMQHSFPPNHDCARFYFTLLIDLLFLLLQVRTSPSMPFIPG